MHLKDRGKDVKLPTLNAATTILPKDTNKIPPIKLRTHFKANNHHPALIIISNNWPKHIKLFHIQFRHLNDIQIYLTNSLTIYS